VWWSSEKSRRSEHDYSKRGLTVAPVSYNSTQGKDLAGTPHQMGDQDSDSEAMSQPEVATVSKVIKNKKRKKKKKAHKRRREALKKKARSWNTTKGLLCCCRHFFVLNPNEFH